MKRHLTSTLFVALAAVALLGGCAEEQQATTSTGPAGQEAPMNQNTLGPDAVRHIVVLKYTPDATEAQIEEITSGFRALQDSIPGIVDFEFGVNNSPEGKSQDFTHIYQVTFEDSTARNAYLPHPKHMEFVELLGSSGILVDAFVVDYVPQE